MNASFIRKVVYLSLMGLLLLPLSMLGTPENYDKDGNVQAGSGGKLAQMRQAEELSPARLGAIDPASETIKLACLGMRGVAANLLWKKANDYQREHDWTNLSAVLEQLSHLQPHFIKVWQFQGWNLSYNVAAEWDDYRQRYAWLLKGIKFLEQGTYHNKRVPILHTDMGFNMGHKMGTADEKKQYRALFRKDEDFNVGLTPEERDNWLVGKKYHVAAQKLVDTGARLSGVNPVVFHSYPAKWQTNYTAALEVDGGEDGKAVFGDRARVSWDIATKEWDDFSRRDVPTPFGLVMQLGAVDDRRKELAEAHQAFEDLSPGLRDKLKLERIKLLPAHMRAALEKSAASRSQNEDQHAGAASQAVQVGFDEAAENLPAEKQKAGMELAEQITRLESVLRSTTVARDTIQYVYWTTRCQAERTDEALAARELMYKANQAYLVETDLPGARDLYEQSFVQWRKLLDNFPTLINDRVIQDDLVGPIYLRGGIRYYEEILKKLEGGKFPENFILQDVIDRAGADPPIGNK